MGSEMCIRDRVVKGEFVNGEAPESGETAANGELETTVPPTDAGSVEGGEAQASENTPEDGSSGETATEASENENETEVTTGRPSEVEHEAGIPAAGGVLEQHFAAYSGANRYVTVYDRETGTSSVYDLKEYLSLPEEKLVSQEERAEQLEELGFHTTLSDASQLPKETANGLLLMYLTAGGTLILLACMGLLKKRKLDRKEK